MKISVDDKETQPHVLNPGPQSIQGIVDNLSSELPSDRIIAEVLLDGRPFYLHSARNMAIDKVEELTIRTANRKSWAVGGVELCLDLVQQIQKSMMRVALAYRDERIPEAHKLFSRCLDGLDRIVSNFEITKKALGDDMIRFEVNGDSAHSLEMDLRHILDGILESQRNKNYSELADRIEIGLLTHFQRWITWMRWLSENHRSDD